MKEVLLGIDIGTSGCKALLIDRDGIVVGSRTVPYGLSQPRPGWTEQDPQLWINGARTAVSSLVEAYSDASILAVGLSGQMHGLTALDASDRVIRPALLWNDQRNAAECAAITELAGGEVSLQDLTNNRMLIGYTGGKILWMRNHEPEAYRRIKTILNPKDYIRLVLTGEIATEVSDASGTGLFDTRARMWSVALLDRIDIDPAFLPRCHESSVVTGRVSAAGAAMFGLHEGLPVVGGGGDSVIQTLGSGVIVPGELQTTIGTAGIVASALDEAIDNPGGRLQVFCNVAPNKWHAMGVTLNAGFAMSWFQSLCGGLCGSSEIRSVEEIVALAQTSAPGSHGLLFLPYLNGERAPHSDPDARAAFIGMSGLHGAADISRAVMEGIAYALYDIYSVMRAGGIASKVIKASGGGAKSSLWRQMQADLFGCQVITTEGAAEGAAFGAALVAGVGVGVWADADAASTHCRPLTNEQPNAVAGAVLTRAFATYQALYPVLAPHFKALANGLYSQAATSGTKN